MASLLANFLHSSTHHIPRHSELSMGLLGEFLYGCSRDRLRESRRFSLYARMTFGMQFNQQRANMIINNPMATLIAACRPKSGATTNAMRGRVQSHIVRVSPIVSIPGRNSLIVRMIFRSNFSLRELLSLLQCRLNCGGKHAPYTRNVIGKMAYSASCGAGQIQLLRVISDLLATPHRVRGQYQQPESTVDAPRKRRH